MPLTEKKIKKILRKNKEVFEILENYDKTRELPFKRKRIDLTLAAKTISNLKKISEREKKPISRIIDEKFSDKI